VICCVEVSFLAVTLLTGFADYRFISCCGHGLNSLDFYLLPLPTVRAIDVQRHIVVRWLSCKEYGLITGFAYYGAGPIQYAFVVTAGSATPVQVDCHFFLHWLFHFVSSLNRIDK
jgi:hypothetical protein